jgi:hypothetical protein
MDRLAAAALTIRPLPAPLELRHQQQSLLCTEKIFVVAARTETPGRAGSTACSVPVSHMLRCQLKVGVFR